MIGNRWVALSLGVVFAWGVCAAGPASAGASSGRVAVGVEAGLPLVLGVDASYRLDGPWRLGMGIGKLGGLTALRAEARLLMRREEPERLVPCLILGAEQYFLKDGQRDATPVGIHFALGLDYRFESPVSVGARIGGLKTFGSSGGGDVRVFSVENGYKSGLFNLGVRYHF